MAENGYITDAERAAAAAAPLGTTRPYQSKTDRMGSWFIEDVRRELIGKFGETAETGPNSVYAGGLWIRTSIDPTIQRAPERDLRNALFRFDRPKGCRGPADNIALGAGWGGRLRAPNLPVGYAAWRGAGGFA